MCIRKMTVWTVAICLSSVAVLEAQPGVGVVAWVAA